MPNPKLMFFINGTETSAAGVRARMFAQQLSPQWDMQFNYRPRRKWQGIIPFIQSALHFKPDIIYVMDTAYTGVLAGCLSQQLIGCKLITDTGDVAYELAKSTGTYSKSQLVLIRWIEQMAIANSDCLIVRGSYHKQLLREQGVQNVEFVPDGVNTQAISDIDPITAKAKLGLGNHLVVGLIGSMQWSERHRMCYGWDIIEALKFLKGLPVKALLVGDGSGRPILEHLAERFEVRDQVVFSGQVPYEELPHYLAAMDVCVSTQSNDRVGIVRTTGKLPLYLAYGKYVIATDVGEASRVLPEVGCLLPYTGVRDDEHPARLAAQLQKVIAAPYLLEISEKAKQVAKKHFDYAMLATRIEKICLDLVSA
ncbi:glycosyltransferase [Leptolyngbya sp. FACHB-711]|uniref:glycosyltransferase n=1 Tax=unclassified Leptolyngbya TaxID=2650499 RepID=UPI0016872026|nr:glycosyltransferase [Leptolyngbya sp. FACHB-711]MBD2028350.1 glycosyltransferase [Leptolyngbya sp. FACHB-711]